MKITDIHIDLVRDPDYVMRGEILESVIVRVETDEGITGIGEASSSPYVVRAILEAPTFFTVSRAFRDLLIGRDPLEIGALWEEVYRLTLYPGRRGAYIHALSAIDITLWDILGKVTQLPLYKLLGGAFQREIRAYASHVMPSTPDETREVVAEAVAEGWPALKIGWFPYDTSADSDRAMVRAAREGAGAEATLMLDIGPRWETTAAGRSAVQLWDSKTAIQRISSWSEFEPFWIEEPLPPDDLDGYRRLCDAVGPYIAAGEEEATRFPLYDLMDRGGIDIVQFDVGRVGGLTEARRVVHAAHDRNRPFAPHCFGTQVLWRPRRTSAQRPRTTSTWRCRGRNRASTNVSRIQELKHRTASFASLKHRESVSSWTRSFLARCASTGGRGRTLHTIFRLDARPFA